MISHLFQVADWITMFPSCSFFGFCFSVFFFFFWVALAVLLDFLLQVTAFVALIVYDFLRAEDNRIDCIPCVKVSASNSDPDTGKCSNFSPRPL